MLLTISSRCAENTKLEEKEEKVYIEKDKTSLSNKRKLRATARKNA